MSSLPDFDTLVDLAQNNPEELERLRRREIAKLIAQAPEHTRRRLEGLQFQIDAKRAIHKDSPMGSCITISKMMHESFAELCVWLNILTGKDKGVRKTNQVETTSTGKSAKILAFNNG